MNKSDLYVIKDGKILNGIDAIKVIGMAEFQKVKDLAANENVSFIDIYFEDGGRFSYRPAMKGTEEK